MIAAEIKAQYKKFYGKDLPKDYMSDPIKATLL
jgi:hypothetical protein